MAVGPITWAEINAYDAATLAGLSAWDKRLIRRADDKGVFVMLDAAAPTRLFSSLPEGVRVDRLGLVDVIEAVTEFLSDPSSSKTG